MENLLLGKMVRFISIHNYRGYDWLCTTIYNQKTLGIDIMNTRFKQNIIIILLLISINHQLNQNGFAKINVSHANEKHIILAWKSFDNQKHTISPQANYPYMNCFKEASAKHNIPVSLLLALARGESFFNPKAISKKNCYGLMQIQWPGTAKDLGIYSKKELFNPCVNINAGAKYLAWLLKRYNGNTYLAIAAYNYGPNRIRKGTVPDGAQWYASYIYEHLDYVLENTSHKTNKSLVLEFTHYHMAETVMINLQHQVKDVPFEIFKSLKYTYDICFVYQNKNEKQKFINKIQQQSGIRPLSHIYNNN